MFEVFWAVKEQWNMVVGMQSIYYQSIQTQAILSACQLLNIVDTPPILAGILLMQDAAKKVLNER